MSSPSFFPPELKRTGDDFTTGIVNVPMHTPANLMLVVRDMSLLDSAIAMLRNYNIAFKPDVRRTKAILKSSELIARPTLVEIKSKFPQYEPKIVSYYRYIFFELDTLEEAHVQQVLSVFKAYNLPVFYHRTMRGWHFFCIKPQGEELYHEVMEKLKPLNMACPHVTMRIKPNKWVGEPEIFRVHNIVMPALHSDTERFAKMIIEQTYHRLMSSFGTGKYVCDKKYLVVNYKQTGELAHL